MFSPRLRCGFVDLFKAIAFDSLSSLFFFLLRGGETDQERILERGESCREIEENLNKIRGRSVNFGTRQGALWTCAFD